MFRIEFLLHPENQSSGHESGVGSKGKEKGEGKSRLEYQLCHRWLTYYNFFFFSLFKTGLSLCDPAGKKILVF